MRIEDLAAIGLAEPTIRRIQDDVASLDAALVRLAAVHRDYHAARSAGERQAIDAHARGLHIAVDRAEFALHEQLSPAELALFHAYLWPRLAAAGLSREEEHHERGGVRSGVVRGFDHDV